MEFDNKKIGEILETYPDLVADAQLAWSKAAVETKRCYARLYLTIKAKLAEKKPTQTELDSQVKTDDNYYAAQMEEIKAESDFTRKNETLMAAKRMAGLRTAF